jgi:ABC-type transport system involved in multi-copper enzyme maturation permease subunit
MMNLINSDFKKVFYLPAYRKLLVTTIILSILFGAIFLFTIGITQGKQLTDLTFLEMVDISFLGIDAAAIMMIIFTAIFISKDLAPGAVHTNLAITPVRRKYFLSKILFLSILSVVISIIVLALLLVIDHLAAAANGISGVGSVESGILLKIIGSIMMVLFYSILSAAGAFFIQSAAGGISFALGVMFLPALIKLFPADLADPLLAIFPENALSAFIEMNSFNGSITLSVIILLVWVILSSIIGLWKFNRIDY